MNRWAKQTLHAVDRWWSEVGMVVDDGLTAFPSNIELSPELTVKTGVSVCMRHAALHNHAA